MNKISSAFILSLLIGSASSGEEGMWFPPQIPSIARSFKAQGLEIDPRGLTDLTSYPMGAVVRLGGCSASFVSPDGLIITNYHCAYSSIQLNSSVENNLLAKGFLAHSRKEELPASPGLRVLVTVGFQDVTGKVLEGLDGVGSDERAERIDARRQAFVSDCEKEPGIRCQVASFYGGVQYSLVRQKELRDVRLVYAPPEGIGRYGGDVDNFTWPQQKGDFAFFRAYVGPGGEAADASPDNQPFHPKHHLKVSQAPLKDGDFLMVVGYPNATNRYRLSSEVEDSFLWQYPRLIESYETSLQVVRDAVKGRPEAALKYAGFDAGLNNSLKYARGMLDSFAGSRMLDRKLALEKDLGAWVDADPRRKAAYGDAVKDLRGAFAGRRETREFERRYHLATRSSLLTAARQLYQLAKEREKPESERASGYREKDLEKLRQSLEKSGRSFDPQVDRAIWRTFILDYDRLPAEQRVGAFDRWFELQPGQDAGKLDSILDRMYAETRLGNIGNALDLTKASAKDIESSPDPFLKLAVLLYESDLAEEKREQEISDSRRALYVRYMSALVAYMESRGDTLYPDANGTLRVAFGAVKGYTPSTGARFEPFTTAEDILGKNTGAEPFNAPASTVQALREKRFGRYRDPRLASLPVNFLGTVDVTGGNSGAPTLNSRGELVGLLFDINQEGIISSWDYNSTMTRSIHLDIRYVLWLLDEVEHAGVLLAEMGVVSPEEAAGRRTTAAVMP